jgi:hypothetical protein
LTPRLQEQLARLSTWMPFAHAVREFAAFTGVRVDPSTARRTTEAAGATLVAQQTAEADQIVATMPAPPRITDPIVVSVDGAMVSLRHGLWGEVRTLALGVPHRTTDADGAAVIKTDQLSYFSRLMDSETFTHLANVELQRRGVEGAPAVAGVVDGAVWCQTFLDLHVPSAVRILDFPHAASYIQAIGDAQGAAGRLLAPADVTQVLDDLKQRGPTSVLAQMRQVVAGAVDGETTGKALAYLEKREAQLDYPRFQAEGWPIGSGMVESANKLVVQARLKGAGMHWAAEQVNAMLALRNAVCNDRWVEAWIRIEAGQRTALADQRRVHSQKRQAARMEPDAPPAAHAPTPPHQRLAPAVLARVRAEEAQERVVHPWKQAWSVRRQNEEAVTV